MLETILLAPRKFVAPEIVFGLGTAKLAGRYAANFHAGKVLVVSDPGVAHCGWTKLVQDSLSREGLAIELFDAVSTNPRESEIMAGADLYARAGCGALVAVGGGGPMDCAKSIGLVVGGGRSILEYAGVDMAPAPGPPLVCIPTTAGSSSEVSQFASVVDARRKVKLSVISKALIPDVALIDPSLTTTMDHVLTASTGFAALSRAVEAYVSNVRSPFTDLFALESVRLVKTHLAAATRKPLSLDARAGMALASLYAGLAASNAIPGATQAMAHGLCGLYDLPHAQCAAILLEGVMDYNFQAEPERYAALGQAMGAATGDAAAPSEDKQAALSALRRLKRELGLTTTLGELGVKEEDIPQLASLAMDDPCMAANPRRPSADDIEALYAQAL